MSEYKKIENAKVEVTCTLEGEKWNNAKTKELNKALKKVEIKGFRKGQAPKAMASKYVNMTEVLLNAAEDLAQEALDEAIKEHDLYLIDRPELKLDDLNEDKCVLTFVCPVKPDVEVGDYKAIKYEEVVAEVTDEDIDADIARVLESKADLELKEEGSVEQGDVCTIDYEGFLDGVPFEGGKDEGHDLTIGSNSFIPGFEEQLIGMNSEETKEIEVTFPEDYQAEDLKGKATKFVVTVHEIKKKVLPTLDDDFVAELNYEDVKTVEDYKAYTKKNIEDTRAREAQRAAEAKLQDDLAAITTVEIPEAMVNTEIDHMVNNYRYQLSYNGIALEQFISMMGTTMEGFREQMRPEAVKSVTYRLALEEIGKKENVEVTAEDIEAEYERVAPEYGYTVENLKAAISEADIKASLIYEKTFELLKENK